MVGLFSEKGGRISLRKAKFVLEYAALFAVVAFALIAMKKYMQRAFMGRYRQLADQIGTQYDPQAAFIDSVVVTNTTTEEYMMFDNSTGEYVGTTVISSSNERVDSQETVDKPIVFEGGTGWR